MPRPTQPARAHGGRSEPREVIIVDSDTEESDGSIEIQPVPTKFAPLPPPPPPRPAAPARPRTPLAPAAVNVSASGGGRPHTELQLPSSSAPSDTLANRPPSPDHPLPHRPYPFNILNHAPARDPAPPLAYKAPEQMTTAERAEEHFREEEREERDRAQRKLREPAGGEWEWEWSKVKVKGKDKEERKHQPAQTRHAASFFPHVHLPGLQHMRNVFAVVGGNTIELHRIEDASTSKTTDLPTKILARTKLNRDYVDESDKEQLFTCAWSVNITTAPYTPVLAVAGRGRAIEIFLVAQRSDGEWLLYHDRSITGHGGSIFHLTFHASYPHVLASCSEDKTVRLWDVAVPWGSDRALQTQMAAWRRAGRTSKRIWTERPRVEGELLAVFAEKGHERAVFSCDLHAVQPLLVTCGADGYIRMWHIPRAVFESTPYWPSTPLFTPPEKPRSAPRQPPVLGPPFFSTLAIHPGQWPDQVLFASPTTCAVISKAGVSHERAQHSPRKSVKVWVPTILDVLPDMLAGPAAALQPRPDSGIGAASGPSEILDLSSIQTCLPTDARSDGAFRIAYEAVVEDQNCVGDKIGWYRPPRLRRRDAAALVEDAFFAIPTGSILPLSNSASSSSDRPSLFFFRPFALPPSPSRVRSHTKTSGESSTAMRRTASLGTSQSGSNLVPSHIHTPETLAEALFPPDRDRDAHDFTPRLLPSFVTDELPGAGSCDQELVHARCVAVDPDGAKHVVAVGDGGLLAVWTRRQRVWK